MSLTQVLVIALIVIVGAIVLLCRKLRRLRKEKKCCISKLQECAGIMNKMRETEECNMRLGMENLILRTLLIRPEIQDLSRSIFGKDLKEMRWPSPYIGQGFTLDPELAYKALKSVRETYDFAKQIVVALYKEAGEAVPQDDDILADN